MTKRIPHGGLSALALYALAVSCGTVLHRYYAGATQMHTRSADPLTVLLGEGRKYFAQASFQKADAYFHRGFTGSMFDHHDHDEHDHNKHDHDEHSHDKHAGHSHGSAMQAVIAGEEHAKCAHDQASEAGDWIARHGRAHFPSTHTHLGDPGTAPGSEREMLPWILLATKLNARDIDSFTVGAYWLRRMGRQADAEAFLRDGLRANPDSSELLFELGKSRYEERDIEQAGNMWLAAWKLWQPANTGLPREDQDRVLADRILTHLAMLESQRGNQEGAIGWLETLLPVAVHPANVRDSMNRVRAGEKFGFERNPVEQ